jgi:hypothetical protein
LPAVHVHFRAKKFSVFVEKENDFAPFRVVHHHVGFALPFFHWKFLVADHENNGLAPVFLIAKRRREPELGGRARTRIRRAARG